MFNPIGRIVDSVVPTVVGAVDVDDVVSRIDVDELLSRVDVNALMSRIDVEQLLARIDVNALMSRVDLQELLARLDVNELMGRVDVDALLARIVMDDLFDRVDIDHLLDRIDVNRMMQRVDLNGLLGRVELDVVLARIDLDAVVDRIDVDRIVQRADLAGIVADSTRGITASTVDLVRRQITGIDAIITRIAARIIRRDPDQDPTSPPALQEVEQPHPTGRHRPSISGHYAGPVARAAAIAIDWSALVFLFGTATAIGRWTIDFVFRGHSSHSTLSPLWASVLLGVWAFFYFAVPLAMAGRTLGKAVVGLRVVNGDGHPLRPWQAAVRVLALPLSFVLLGLGLIGAVFGRQKRTLHDIIARSAEVTDWGDRPAAIPSPLSNWLARRHGEPAADVPTLA